MNASPRLRCAVYTRKSTEEGLDQEFNSLDAQREACEAYILSQASLGWKLVPDRYDDGGISGGTMERPALLRLLQDLRDKKVEVVVVYKIDRLTRSLTDFSRIVEVFDAAGASFVSVTQQFNTTTSMGRLTLNVLLSFAQFEREVTAERIRDKIAASKKKGMWMGGVVPLGYRVENRKLLIDEQEAPTVRHLFERYLKLRSVRAKNGLDVLTRPFGRGNLYHLLSNPIYIGKVRHRDQVYDGEHTAIVDADVFARAQALLATQAPPRSSRTNGSQPNLLTGLIFDEAGDLLRPVHANKQGVRYRYYVSKAKIEASGRKGSSEGWRLPAHELDSLVEHQLNRILRDTRQLADWIEHFAGTAEIERGLARAELFRLDWVAAGSAARKTMLRQVFRGISLRPNWINFEVDRAAVMTLLLGHAALPSAEPAEPTISIDVPITLRRRGVETKMVLTD